MIKVICLGFGMPPESIDFTAFLKRPSEKMSTKLATLRFCDRRKNWLQNFVHPTWLRSLTWN
jgi:hypothetical protein